MKYLILALFLLIPSCASIPGSESLFDGKPVVYENHIIRSNILWIMYETRWEVKEACEALGLRANKGYQIMACALHDLSNGTCTIYAKIPEFVNDRDTTFLGHEMLHCFMGAFHK